MSIFRKEILFENKSPTLSKHIKIGSPEHMTDIVDRFNHHQWNEHSHYMNRGSGPSNENKQAHHALQIHLANEEFKHVFGHLIPTQDKKTFNLGHYDTDNSVKFTKEWHKPLKME